MVTQRKRDERLSHARNSFIAGASRKLDLPKDQAEKVLMVFLTYLMQRVVPEEAKDLMSQLPVKIQEDLRQIRKGPDLSISAVKVVGDLEAIAASEGKTGKELAEQCWLYLAERFREDPASEKGELADLKSQLPTDLKQLVSKAG